MIVQNSSRVVTIASTCPPENLKNLQDANDFSSSMSQQIETNQILLLSRRIYSRVWLYWKMLVSRVRKPEFVTLSAGRAENPRGCVPWKSFHRPSWMDQMIRPFYTESPMARFSLSLPIFSFLFISFPPVIGKESNKIKSRNLGTARPVFVLFCFFISILNGYRNKNGSQDLKGRPMLCLVA